MKRFPMPDSVRVGYKTYDIDAMLPSESSALGSLGICDRLNLTIKLRTDLPIQQTVNTLLHEIMHACYDACELVDSSNEETIVTLLTNALQQVGQDNPDVIKWIFQEGQK